MTVEVGKKQINLGWETLAGLIIFTVSTTWATAFYFNRRDAKQDLQNEKIDRIYAAMMQIRAKDSIYDIKFDTVYSWHAVGKSERENIKQNVAVLMDVLKTRRPTSPGLYTERVVNGHVIFEPVNK